MESLSDFKNKVRNIDWENTTNIPGSDVFTIFDDYEGSQADFENSFIVAVEITGLWWPNIGHRPEPEEGIAFNGHKNMSEVKDHLVYAKGLIKNCDPEPFYINMDDIIWYDGCIMDWCESNLEPMDEECEEHIKAFDWAYNWIEKKDFLLNFIANKVNYNLSQ